MEVPGADGVGGGRVKTPEDIKKGLECCAEDGNCSAGCPYNPIRDCGNALYSDALAYIQQLERERNVAVARLARFRKCIDCAHYGDVVKNNAICEGCEFGSEWQWRGVKNDG